MNGYECSMCDQDPCICTRLERAKNIKEGKIALESMWQAMAHLPVWRMKIIRWFWPDIVRVIEDLKEYYWKDE